MTEKRILVVDDDVLRLRFMESCLESGGYAVKTAENGQEALSKLGQTAYDTVLVDYRMPDGLAEALFLSQPDGAPMSRRER
jgi:twitching motility two-component system response regulator PilH